MSTDLTVRAPRPEDAEEWVRIHLVSWRWSYAHLFSPEFFEAMQATAEGRARTWREMFERSGEDGVDVVGGPCTTLRLAERDGQVLAIGVSSAPVQDEEQRGTELDMLYADPQHARTGAGSALLEALLGDGPAHLWVFEDNPIAGPFYAHHGFRPDGARRDVLEHPAVRLVRG